MLHNTDSKIVSLQVSKIQITDPVAGDVPEFQVTNRLIYNHTKGSKPQRHNVVTMVNKPYLLSADDGPIAQNRSAI